MPSGSWTEARITMKKMSNEEKKSFRGKLRKLFFSTLYLSAFTFGGGYVIVSLLKKKFVDELHWVEEEEMLDLVAIAQSSPGAIAVNGAIVIGYRLAGIPGVLVSVLGAVLPPFVILTAISYFYRVFQESFVVQAMLSGMKSGVSAVILSVVYDMMAGIAKEKDPLLWLVLLGSFLANYLLSVNVVYIILFVILLGLIQTLWRERREK